MTCEYCEKSVKENINGTVFSKPLKDTYGETNHHTVCIGSAVYGRHFLLVEEAQSIAAFSTYDINYCPMCGRELKGGVDND